VAVVLSARSLAKSVTGRRGAIDGNLRPGDFRGNLPDVAPSISLSISRKTQIEGYTKRLTDDPAVRRIDSAPMLRGSVTPESTAARQRLARRFTGVCAGDRGVTYAEPLHERHVSRGDGGQT